MARDIQQQVELALSIERLEGMTFSFDPNEARDERGRWTDSGRGSGGKVMKRDLIERFPRLKPGQLVDGRKILKDIPNTSSISSSLDRYEVMPGIREVPTSLFGEAFSTPPHSYSATENKRVADLAAKINRSGKIKPLIVVVEKGGPYILEGGHRFDALRLLKAKSFPAMVVVNREEGLGLSFDPNEPRDWNGRWTEDTGGGSGGGISSPHHQVAYNDKVVSMDYISDPKNQFKMSGMRVADNLKAGGKGYILTPKGQIYEITRESRKAKLLKGDEAETAKAAFAKK